MPHYHVVEKVTQSGQVLLTSRYTQLFFSQTVIEILSDIFRGDLSEVQSASFSPDKEHLDGVQVWSAGVRISDPTEEEFFSGANCNPAGARNDCGKFSSNGNRHLLADPRKAGLKVPRSAG